MEITMKESFYDTGVLFHVEWKERGELDSENDEVKEGLNQRYEYLQKLDADSQSNIMKRQVVSTSRYQLTTKLELIVRVSV